MSTVLYKGRLFLSFRTRGTSEEREQKSLEQQLGKTKRMEREKRGGACVHAQRIKQEKAAGYGLSGAAYFQLCGVDGNPDAGDVLVREALLAERDGSDGEWHSAGSEVAPQPVEEGTRVGGSVADHSVEPVDDLSYFCQESRENGCSEGGLDAGPEVVRPVDGWGVDDGRFGWSHRCHREHVEQRLTAKATLVEHGRRTGC